MIWPRTTGIALQCGRQATPAQLLQRVENASPPTPDADAQETDAASDGWQRLSSHRDRACPTAVLADLQSLRRRQQIGRSGRLAPPAVHLRLSFALTSLEHHSGGGGRSTARDVAMPSACVAIPGFLICEVIHAVSRSIKAWRSCAPMANPGQIMHPPWRYECLDEMQRRRPLSTVQMN